MALPTKQQLNEIARQRGEIMRAAEKGLLSKSKELEKKLQSFVLNSFLPELEIKNNRIVNSAANLKKVNDSASLKKFLKVNVNSQMREYYTKEFTKITASTGNYFNIFPEPLAGQKKSILQRGELIVEGYLDGLFDNNQIATSIQSTIRNSVNTSQTLSTLGKLVTEQIKGKEDKFGAITNYHYQNGYDQFQTYSRALDEDYSVALQLNYAIYAGGEMGKTRDFCAERNGNVYNRETVLSWNDLDWQGKKANNNILIDLGGYNCRHDLDWISYQLAKKLDPTIEKSTFDK